jgi:hypothetical protein
MAQKAQAVQPLLGPVDDRGFARVGFQHDDVFDAALARTPASSESSPRKT